MNSMSKLTKKLPKVDVIVDLQFGSTGKGALAGWLAINNDLDPYDVVVSANQPNAGHTFIDDRGNKMIHKVLPNSVVGPHVRLALIGPGAVFSPARLKEEMETLKAMGYDQFRVMIHDQAVALKNRHVLAETGMDHIGSTKQGAGAASMEKMERDPEFDPLVRREDIEDIPNVQLVCNDEYFYQLYSARRILVEGAQGFSLGINAGFWPYCTSRNCTVSAILDQCAVPATWIGDIYGSCRTYPIRVGGTSGPGYPDQEESTWEQIGQTPELTTVTKKVRRVFTFSKQQIREAIFANQPTNIFLNFANYVDDGKLFDIISTIDSAAASVGSKGRVSLLGWGPTVEDMEVRSCFDWQK